MEDRIIQSVLDFMGYLASFFIQITPDNYLFVELATFLAVLWLIAAIILFILTTRR